LHQHSEKPCNSEQKSQQAYFWTRYIVRNVERINSFHFKKICLVYSVKRIKFPNSTESEFEYYSTAKLKLEVWSDRAKHGLQFHHHLIQRVKNNY
jgi:hypothetical protein